MHGSNSSNTNSQMLGSKRNKEPMEDPWAHNVHMTREHEDPTMGPRLAENQKLVAGHDKFVEYIRHVESKFTPPLFISFKRRCKNEIRVFLSLTISVRKISVTNHSSCIYGVKNRRKDFKTENLG